MNVLFWVIGFILIVCLLFSLKDAKTVGEVMRKLIVFYSVVIFILMVIILTLIFINGLGLPSQGKVKIGIGSVIVMIICIFLYQKNKI